MNKAGFPTLYLHQEPFYAALAAEKREVRMHTLNALIMPDLGELGACHHRLPHGDSHPVAVLIGTGRAGANPVDNIRESGLYRHPFGCRIPRQRRPSDGV